MRKLNGVHVPHRKNTSEKESVRMPTPSTVSIPMVMHIGAPAKPIVKPGDVVKVGQKIAEAGGFVSSPIYSSVSGKVKRLDQVLLSSGNYVPAVFIESDGEQTPFEELAPREITDLQSFVDAVRDSGVVGLGGAGFPTSVKLNADPARVDYIVINAAECEPYITSDTRTMLEESDSIWEGIQLLKKFYDPKKVIIGIEDNKPQCIKLFRKLAENDSSVEVASLPAVYPQGGEKVLIFHTTGRVVGEGKLPLDVGVIVINCTTLSALDKFIKTGMPLVEKCITVDGSAVAEPKNVLVPIGTKMQDVFDFCGGFRTEAKKILYGGPMMGIAVPSTDVPVLKNTNAILAFDAKDAAVPEESACIKCGQCINHCPMNLMPADIDTAFQLKKPETLEVLKVNLCMECGCCSFVCPAKRHLVQTNKLAKTMLRNYQQEQKAKKEKKEAEAAK